MAFKYESPNCPECGEEIFCELDDVTALGTVARVGTENYAFAGDTFAVMWAANEAKLRVHGQTFVIATCKRKHHWQTVKSYVRGAEDPVTKPKWVGEGADEAEKLFRQSGGKPDGVLDSMGKYTVATLDWDGSLLLSWIAAEDADAAVAEAILHEAPMEVVVVATNFLSEEELRDLRLRESKQTLRRYTVTGEAEDGRPIYEWVEAADAAAAVHQVSFKFGKFDPHVALPGHHRPSELPAASEKLSGNMTDLWANSVVEKPLN